MAQRALAEELTDEEVLRIIVRERMQQRLTALSQAGSSFWAPHPENKPQNLAYNSEADETLYGGGAGGGKTDLLIGLGVTRHKKGVIYRKQKVDTKGIKDRGIEVLGSEAWSTKDNAFITPDGRQLELGHATTQRDLNAQQGRARDLVEFDELAQFTLAEYLWLTGWNRSSDPNQRCRIVSGSNPPMTAEGFWIIERWAPWLDKKHPKPAQSGEIRWFATIEGKDTEVDGPEPFTHTNRDGTSETITPRSRTFIRALLEDNPYYKGGGYRSILQALPEPMRSAMLKGDFTATMQHDPWQVIPTAWVDAAMARWRPRETDKAKGPMDALGVDPARGGLDAMTLAPRHGDWYDEIVKVPGAEVDTGRKALAHIMLHLRNGAPVHVDVIGIGAAVYDACVDNDLVTVGIDVREASNATDRSGIMRFVNKRAELAWLFREALDPETGDGMALPPDPELKADLCSMHYEVTPRGIKIELKEDIKERLGRSPDKGDAVLLAWPNIAMARAARKRSGVGSDPQPVEDDDPRRL